MLEKNIYEQLIKITFDLSVSFLGPKKGLSVLFYYYLGIFYYSSLFSLFVHFKNCRKVKSILILIKKLINPNDLRK